MKIRKINFLRPAMLIAALTASGAAAQTACPENNARLAIKARDMAVLSAVYESIQFNTACSDALREDVRMALAATHFDAAGQAMGSERIALLERAVVFGRRWEYRAALGEALLHEKAYGRAAAELQTAINRLNDNPYEGEIDAAGVERLIRLASTAIALSEETVDVPRGRNGTPGGVFAERVRGFVVREVPVRITFEYDSAALTTDGEKEAQRFAEALIREAPEAITLEGHTDPLGEESYNLELSRRRAETMRDYLVESGFTGEVRIVAKGESDPPEIAAGLELDEEEVYQMARRVELVR